MDEIYADEKKKSKQIQQDDEPWLRTHTLIDQEAIELLSQEYNLPICTILRHLASKPAYNSSILFQVVVLARLSQRPEFRLMPHRDREERQMKEGLSVAGMASLYYKSVTGVKPHVLTLARFRTERDRISEQYGGKIATNYLLGRIRDIDAEDQEQAAKLQRVMRECSHNSTIFSSHVLIEHAILVDEALGFPPGARTSPIREQIYRLLAEERAEEHKQLLLSISQSEDAVWIRAMAR